MVCSQLVVKRTFLEVETTNLKQKDFTMRRSRCMSESMVEICWPSDCEKETDVRSTTTTVCWSDMSDDAGSDGGWSDSSRSSAPSMPPGVFLQDVAYNRVCSSTSHGGAKRSPLWNSVAQEVRTTVLIRNVHPTTSRSDLCTLLDQQGFRAQYDFLYLPANFKTMLSFGYAFVNFVSGRAAVAAKEHFAGFQWHVNATESSLETTWSDPHQGYIAHVERYRDCPVMHSIVADEYKPIVLRNGVRVKFPDPTKKLVAPRDVRRRHGA